MRALRVIAGPHAPQLIAVPASARFILLGRRCKAPDALAGGPGLLHVALPDDKEASSLHAVLCVLGGAWVLCDAGSLNGTKVGEHALAACSAWDEAAVRGAGREVRAGDTFCVGASVFLVERGAGGS